MDLSAFRAGSFRQASPYRYFLPEPINHVFTWSDPAIGEMLERAILKLGG